MSLRIRRQHQSFRWRRDNPSFHNFAMQNSRWDHFIILAVLPPGPTAAGFSQQDQALLLNMLEMWCALLFCTLQPDILAQWHKHGAGASAGMPWVALNLACPLDQGGPAKFVELTSRHPLSQSQDPLARSYAVGTLDRKREATPGSGQIFGLMMGVVFVILISAIVGGQGGQRRR